MSENTTRISDLPENNTLQMNTKGDKYNFEGGGGGGENFWGNDPTYKPMNIHPNPYGNTIENNVMPLPQKDKNSQNNVYLPQEQHTIISGTPVVKLPSRDIPMDMSNYQQDEEIKANYIPHSGLKNDYVEDHEEINENKIKKHEKQKKRAKYLDDLINEIQTPLLLSLLFLFFHLPIFNNYMNKRMGFLNLFSKDGNINFNGILLKSTMFGVSFYIINKITDWIVNF